MINILIIAANAVPGGDREICRELLGYGDAFRSGAWVHRPSKPVLLADHVVQCITAKKATEIVLPRAAPCHQFWEKARPFSHVIDFYRNTIEFDTVRSEH